MALWWCVPVSGTAAGTLVSVIVLSIGDMSMKIRVGGCGEDGPTVRMRFIPQKRSLVLRLGTEITCDEMKTVGKVAADLTR
jgi:hypothetical protein